jgi:hypothetical protein
MENFGQVGSFIVLMRCFFIVVRLDYTYLQFLRVLTLVFAAVFTQHYYHSLQDKNVISMRGIPR